MYNSVFSALVHLIWMFSTILTLLLYVRWVYTTIDARGGYGFKRFYFFTGQCTHLLCKICRVYLFLYSINLAPRKAALEHSLQCLLALEGYPFLLFWLSSSLRSIELIVVLEGPSFVDIFLIISPLWNLFLLNSKNGRFFIHSKIGRFLYLSVMEFLSSI